MRDRHLNILKIVNEKEKVSVKELSDELGISMVTIRKDLEELENEMLLHRSHGFAEKIPTDAIDARMTMHYSEKKAIAKAAAALVGPQETIMIESGSTCALFAQTLSGISDITIITNSSYIARHMHEVQTARVILLGGDYDPVSETVTGPVTKLCAEEYHVDKIFVGVDGYTIEDGFTNVNHTRCATVRDMASRADNVIVLTTSDKFGKCSVARMLKASDVQMVLTDGHLDEEFAQDLRGKGVKVEMISDEQ